MATKKSTSPAPAPTSAPRPKAKAKVKAKPDTNLPTTYPTPITKTIKMENSNFAALETEVAQLRQVNTNAIAIANFAFGKLNEIETRLIGSPAIAKLLEKNKDINFLFLLLNSSLIRDIIKAIVAIIREVKDKIKELNEQAQAQANNGTK